MKKYQFRAEGNWVSTTDEKQYVSYEEKIWTLEELMNNIIFNDVAHSSETKIVTHVIFDEVECVNVLDGISITVSNGDKKHQIYYKNVERIGK